MSFLKFLLVDYSQRITTMGFSPYPSPHFAQKSSKNLELSLSKIDTDFH